MKTAHRWVRLSIKHFPWFICAGCGLVRLKNEATELAVRRGCD